MSAVDRDIRILLVEDSKMTRKMELKALNELGFHNVVEADDGDEAVTKLQTGISFSLIISDWNMPGRSGLDLLKWVRAQESLKSVYFIMATARGEKKQTTTATEAGVSNFITKPFTPPELESIINATFNPDTESTGDPTGNVREPRFTSNGKLVLNVAHIQITDHLTLGVLKNLLDSNRLTARHFELETRCMSSWNPVKNALERGEIDAAFILGPIAMDLFSYGVPIRMVLLAHKNGSICVRKKKAGAEESLQQFFLNKSFLIPHTQSIHHKLAHMFMKEIGLKPGVSGQEGANVFFDVVPPVKMPEFLSGNPDAGGFLVAEPMGT